LEYLLFGAICVNERVEEKVRKREKEEKGLCFLYNNRDRLLEVPISDLDMRPLKSWAKGDRWTQYLYLSRQAAHLLFIFTVITDTKGALSPSRLTFGMLMPTKSMNEQTFEDSTSSYTCTRTGT